MEYYEGLIRSTEFFTTSELAKKLKMNVQVITRKVQSGEIAAYKIGKDWRIPEQSVFEWLEQNSNGNGRTDPRKVSVRKAVPPPALPKRITRHHVLEYILAQFDPDRSYSASEVTRTISRYHDDHDSILQEFVSERMLVCTDGKYRRRPGHRLSGTTVIPAQR